jgi:hypothetical protein
MTDRDGQLDADSPLTLPGFFSALSDGELLGGVCADCGEVLLPPRPACYGCGGRNIEIEPQPETGAIYSYTAVHAPPPELEAEAPYTIAVVELDSGGRLTGRVDADYDAIEIGDPVELRTRALTEDERAVALDHELEWPLHVFEPMEH